MRFEWDDANRQHIARHRVRPSEVEEIFDNSTFETGLESHNGEVRFQDLGMTVAGRILVVVTTIRAGSLRVVTAYDATRRQRIEFLEYLRSLHG